GALANDDVPAVEAMLAESVRAYSDGGGEFFAARVPVVGRTKVARFFTNISRRRGALANATLRMLNGLPAMVIEFAHEATGEARRFAMRLDIDAEGRITALHSVLASRKL